MHVAGGRAVNYFGDIKIEWAPKDRSDDKVRSAVGAAMGGVAGGMLMMSGGGPKCGRQEIRISDSPEEVVAAFTKQVDPSFSADQLKRNIMSQPRAIVRTTNVSAAPRPVPAPAP